MSLLTSSCDPVLDDEILYRRVTFKGGGIKYEHDAFRISASSFNDPKKQPSVDRALLQDKNPENSKKHLTEGIVSLVTGKVRSERIASRP